ncbi:5-methylcytosine restriction system specificity protein McrC [Aminipila sp.]|uniref:5-methylcytosine restriction system specificity protein McrC n=1 Tax=Aminipila sp. TaxID=2060095 RepID=UPI00289892C7|nr:hypothetical protein [Aminipila sp.]
MAKGIIPHSLKDWTQINENESFWGKINLQRPEDNFGIHQYNNGLWTSGMIGVGRVFDIDGLPIQDNGKEHILMVSSTYGMDPWKMLEKVLKDDEYDAYTEELDKANKFLFRIFYDQPVIQLEQDSNSDAEILYALSFLNACYSLCKKGLKKSLIYKNENYTAKLRGKIDVSKNMKHNTARGRSDKFYCKYVDFTEDNIENKIIKAALQKCKATLKQRFQDIASISNRVGFCQNILRHVSSTRITNSDFNAVAVSGLYSYYKPVIQQSRAILGQKLYNYIKNDGSTAKKSVYTIPYVINMETLFEFYTRTILKEILPADEYCLEKYSQKLFLQNGVAKTEDSEKGIHLMSYCIPDIIICNVNTGKPSMVIDAKYKPDNRPLRSDSHQLLSYVLLTGVQKCGFIFPGEITKLKKMESTNSEALPLSAKPVQYYELIMGNDNNAAEIYKALL